MKVRTIVDSQDSNEQQSNVQFKTFPILDSFCIYKNEVDIQDYDHSTAKLNPKLIKVNNTVCKEVDGHLEKVTQIIFKGKKISIKDQYQFNSNQITLQNNQIFGIPKHKHTTLFKKTLTQQGSKQLMKRNTKNLVKNFYKGFVHFLKEEKKKRELYLNEKQQFIFEKNNHYNNELIKKIIKSKDLGQLFRQFLMNYAKEWIDHSKIQDKEIHEQAIEIYLELFKNVQFQVQKNSLDDENEEISVKIEDSQIFCPFKLSSNIMNFSQDQSDSVIQNRSISSQQKQDQ